MPGGMAFGTDGGLWMPGVTGNALLRVDPRDGTMRGSLGNPLPLPGPITQGSDGNMYFAPSFPAGDTLGNQIGMINPGTGQVNVWWTPSSASHSCDVQGEQPGSIWFGEFATDKIGQLHFG